MIVPSLQVVPKRDINPIEARQYSNRNTVYISPTGRDGYLGSTPDLPVKTISQARKLLNKINTNSAKERSLLFRGGQYNITELNPTNEEFTYSDNTKDNAPLIFEPYNKEQVTIAGKHYTIEDISITSNGLWKVNGIVAERFFELAAYIAKVDFIAYVIDFSTPVTYPVGDIYDAPTYEAINTIADYSAYFSVIDYDGTLYYEVVTEFELPAFIYPTDVYKGDEISPEDYNNYRLWRYAENFDYSPSGYRSRPINITGFYENFYLNETRLFPARFPKRGAYNYNNYLVETIAGRKVFRIKDTTNFLSSLQIVPASDSNPSIVVNVDYNQKPYPWATIYNLSSYATNMYVITANINNTGFSIHGYNIIYPETNLSAVAHHLCTEEGEFVVSKENNTPYIYIKPPSSLDINTAIFYARELRPPQAGLTFGSTCNIKIKDFNFKYLNSGIKVHNYSRNVSISGCDIRKCYLGLNIRNTARANIYKNLIFDINNTGISTASLSSTKITNNIVKYVGMTDTQQAFGIGTGSDQYWGNVNMSPTILLSTTPVSFTINLTAVPHPTNDPRAGSRAQAFQNDFNGYAEVTTGDFVGQQRIVSNQFARGPGAVDSVSLTATKGTCTYFIVEPWTPVNGKLSPSPGDMIKYVRGGTGSSMRDTVVDHNYVTNSGAYCMQGAFSVNETISGNYLANSSFGYSGDLGVLYRGSGVCNIKNNIIKNGRRGPGRYNGFALYLDSQHNNVVIENNVISESDGVVFLHEANRATLRNNIIDRSHGYLLGFQHTGGDWSSYGITPTDHQFHSYNNIFITSSSADFLFFKNDNPVLPSTDYRGFDGHSVYNPALRVVHENLNTDAVNYRGFYVSSTLSAKLISDWTAGDKLCRCGVFNERPVYLCVRGTYGFFVSGGNWVFGAPNRYLTLSSTAGIEGYDFPWQVPAGSYFNCRNRRENHGHLDVNFDFGGTGMNINIHQYFKRQVPLMYTHDNCLYTDITNFKTTQYPQLSDNFYAWHGSLGDRFTGTPIGSLKSTVDFGHSRPTFKETQEFWNKSNAYTMSAGFERLVDWEENSIFADPKLDTTTYQLAPDSPAFALGFKQIDTSSIGLFKDDPAWIALAESLSATPLCGSGDWGDWTYANINDPWEPAVFSNVKALTANTATGYYRSASHHRAGNTINLLGLVTPGDGGGGLFEYSSISNATPDNIDIIRPLNYTYGRWIRVTQNINYNNLPLMYNSQNITFTA